jgi:tetratricopeptide (TPR) repeat protein
MKKLLTICLLLVINSTLTAQTAEKYYEIGHNFFLENKGDSAMYYLKKSMTANKNYAPPYRDAGQMIFNGKSYENAYLFLNIYEMLMEESKKEDESYYYWYMKGFLIVHKEYDNEKAIGYFNKSLKYKEDYYKTHELLIDLLIETDPEKAIYHFKRAKELNQNFSYNETDFLNKVADAYLKKYEYTKAIEYYEKILETNTDDIKLETKIALIYKDDLKDYEKAKVKLKKILEKNPQDNNANFLLTELLYLNKKINEDEAITMFSKIKPELMDFGSYGSKDTYSNREYCAANYYLTRIYIHKKDKQKATETLKNMRNLFGLEYNNIVHSYNNLLDVVKEMP